MAGPATRSPWHQLNEPAPDDSEIARDLPKHLYKAKEILGVQRYNDVIRHISNSTDQIVSSTVEAARALAVLGSVTKSEVGPSRDKKELLKAAKKSVRDLLIWRCFGITLGLDSKEAWIRSFEHCSRLAGCDQNTVSQLTNGATRLHKELMGIDTRPNAQETTGAIHTEPTQTGAQTIAAKPAEPSNRAPRAPGYQAQAETTIAFQTAVEPERRHLSLPVGAALANNLAVFLLDAINDGEDDAESQANMSFCLAQLLIACNQHVADDFQSLARAAFLRTLKHVRTDSCKSRLVLKALALLTGEYFLGLPFFEKATSGDSHSAHEQGIDEAMVLAVSETWAWSLSEPEHLQAFQLKQDFKFKESELQQILAWTFALPERVGTENLKKDTARYCCQALGSLNLVIKEWPNLLLRSCNWIVEVVERFIGHPDLVYESLAAFIAIIKENLELFGIDVSPSPTINANPTHARSQDAGSAAGNVRVHLTSQLQDRAMTIACTCEADAAFSIETVKQACKLLAHLHPFSNVVEFVLTRKRCQGMLRDMLWAVLDESYESLAHVIPDCSKVSGCVSIEASDCILPRTLVHVKETGGVGDIPLKMIENFLREPAKDGSLRAPFNLRLPFLFDWVQLERHHQDSRFFLLGILFSPSLLIGRLEQIASCSNRTFSNVLLALSTLNCLEQFEWHLLHELAQALVNLQLPETPSSCVAWVNTLQQCLAHCPREGWQKLEDRDLVECATRQLQQAIYWAAGRTGWAVFLHHALKFLNMLVSTRKCASLAGLEELAMYAQTQVAEDAQAHLQATALLAQLNIALNEYQ